MYLILALAGSAAQIHAEHHTICPGIPVSIDGGNTALRQRACDAVKHISNIAASCDLRLEETLFVYITADRALLLPGCFGSYDCNASLVMLLEPDLLEGTAGISKDAMFDAVLMHESVHAMVSDHLGKRVSPHLASEYIAFALQLEAMSPTDRKQILESQGDAPEIAPELFNHGLLSAAPELFGSAAWMHFKRPENGCGFVADLLSEKVTLGTPLRE